MMLESVEDRRQGATRRGVLAAAIGVAGGFTAAACGVAGQARQTQSATPTGKVIEIVVQSRSAGSGVSEVET